MIKKIIFTLTTLVIFFLLLEFASRIYYPFWYKKYANELLEKEASFYCQDPVLGWTLTPNYQGYREVYNTKHYYSTNSLGIRDKEYPFTKEKGVFRILCLGDSITEGVGVDNDKAYPKILEKMLNGELKGLRVEVINAGVVDYCIEQEYIFLKDRGIKYQPDMVILGYFLNDARGFIPSKAIYLKGYKDIMNKSKFLYLLDQMIMKYKVKYQYKKWEKDRHNFWQPFYDKNTWRASKEDRYKIIELAKKDWGLAWTDKGWQITEEYLDKFLIMAGEYKFKFAVLAFPITVQLAGEDSDTALYLPQERLKDYCLKHGITFVDLLPHLRKVEEKRMFIDACHYSPEGLELISRLTAEAVKDEIFK